MRFIPKSSLDQVEKCEPFVHASQWKSVRESSRTEHSMASGFRNSLQASQSLNDPAASLFLDAPQPLDRNVFQIALKEVPEGYCDHSVDKCFEDGLSFLVDAPMTVSSREEPDYSLELSLLETVNELAASLSKTRARRVHQADVVNDP
jgi:hypothetical protein